MVKSNPDLLILQGLLHLVKPSGRCVRVFPEFFEHVPTRLGSCRTEFRDHGVCVRGVEIALEEPVLQALWASRKAELGAAGFFSQIFGPCHQLVIGQFVDVCASGQIWQGFFIGRHDKSGLHPGDILLL